MGPKEAIRKHLKPLFSRMTLCLQKRIKKEGLVDLRIFGGKKETRSLR